MRLRAKSFSPIVKYSLSTHLTFICCGRFQRCTGRMHTYSHIERISCSMPTQGDYAQDEPSSENWKKKEKKEENRSQCVNKTPLQILALVLRHNFTAGFHSALLDLPILHSHKANRFNYLHQSFLQEVESTLCMGVRREVLRGVHQIQLGVWGALWAPQRGPGRSPGRFWN